MCRFDILYDFDIESIFGFFCEINSINFDLVFTSHSNQTESDSFVKLICFHNDHFFTFSFFFKNVGNTALYWKMNYVVGTCFFL